MSFFKKTNAQQEEFDQFIERIDRLVEQLDILDAKELSSLSAIKTSFLEKTDDFFREDRKLNIGIIGQVKAGKSSFLNTMIFDGQDVLPRASTPKTATLTKIEYAEKNAIEITYYTEEEWQALQERALVDSDVEEYRVAREIISLAKQHQIDVATKLKIGTEIVQFESEQALMTQLNDYVGESGRFTALVKYVTLHVNNPALREISIVDTPGLNDPIASRTDKTKQFIEVCDVVFFLSRAVPFLDTTDMSLLTTQLPQKGVKRLVLVCSRYDEGLQDTIYDADSLGEAHEQTKRALSIIARKNFTAHLQRLHAHGAAPEIVKVMEECKTPIFVSSMTHNMSQKDEVDFAADEQLVYKNLNEHDDLTKEALKKIGNIAEIERVFDEVVAQKEVTLLEKSQHFVIHAEQELKEELKRLEELQQSRLTILQTVDQQTLKQQKQEISQNINDIRASTASVFTDLFHQLEKSKTEGIQALREASHASSKINEHQGIETEERSRTVSTSTWWKPWTWGTSETQYYTVENRYYYLDVADALENLRHFSINASRTVEEAFRDAINLEKMRSRLLKTVVDYFDTASENYDPAYFKLLTEKTLQLIELPVLKIDITQYVNQLSGSFSGKVQDAQTKTELLLELSKSVSQLFEEISTQFSKEVNQFKEELQKIEQDFATQLVKNIQDEYDEVIHQFDQKEREIDKLKEVLSRIQKEYRVFEM